MNSERVTGKGNPISSSRRRFMKILLLAGIPGAFLTEADKRLLNFEISTGLAVIDQQNIWEKSGQRGILTEIKERFNRGRIGCSFSPEQVAYVYNPDFVLSLETYNTPQGQAMMQKAMDTATFAVETLGMTDVRFGIRWNNAVDRQGHLNIRLYEPFLHYLFSVPNTKVSINIGPIKTFRWPEEHIPEGILKKTGSPQAWTEVTSDSELSKQSIAYERTLLDYLKNSRTYTPEELAHIIAIQPDNESNIPFGQYLIKMSRDHMQKSIKVIDEYFPGIPILLNTGGIPEIPLSWNELFIYMRTAMEEMAEFLIELRRNEHKGRLILGYDYYHLTQYSDYLQLGGEKFDTNTILKAVGGIDFFSGIRNELKAYNIEQEITEGQTEPWIAKEEIPTMYQHFKDRFLPGNDSREYLFSLLRELEFTDPAKPARIRLWGIEFLYKAFNDPTVPEEFKREQNKIVEIVQTINAI